MKRRTDEIENLTKSLQGLEEQAKKAEENIAAIGDAIDNVSKLRKTIGNSNALTSRADILEANEELRKTLEEAGV
jgi:prefoldin subunit 5